MSRLFALAAASAAVLGVAACEPQGPGATTAGSAGAVPTGDFVLVGMGAEATPSRDILLTLMPNGVNGRGPCTSYVGQQAATPPAFQLTGFTTSPLGCASKSLENQYFNALQQATGVTYEGGVLKISGPVYLTFEPGRPAAYVGQGGQAQNSTANAVDAAQGFVTQ